MPIKEIRVFSNCDETTIIWQTEKEITGCRGFALERAVKGQLGTSFVPTWVGFKGQEHKPGESRPSTQWPIQRYIWSDYEAQDGQQVRYRAIPMIGPASILTKASPEEWSNWSAWITVGTGQTPGFQAYFNRGIVSAQWLAKQHPTQKSLQADISAKGSKNRVFLSGELRKELLALLQQTKNSRAEIYAALYELNDPELIDFLKALGGKCHLLLGSGAYKTGEPDENADVRKDLRDSSSVNVYDRLVKSPHFAHNKFVVFCDRESKPASVWTGSTNWTVTGLCTQVNNGLLVQSAKLAAAYRNRWEELKNSGALYPASLACSATTIAEDTLGEAQVTAWNVPIKGLADLQSASALIRGAKEGVLFLMFNPGPKGTLLNVILGLDPNKLFIHGVVNQDPGGKKAPLIRMTHKGKQLPPRPLSAILPASLQKSGTWFDKTFSLSRVMIHSKVVLVDPFGSHPVLMTGSHNLGPKASSKNDDNLMVVENAPGLAAEYAVNILGVYGHYKWLYNQSLRGIKGQEAAKKASPQYDGNFDDDKWQTGYTKGQHLREIEFWLK